MHAHIWAASDRLEQVAVTGDGGEHEQVTGSRRKGREPGRARTPGLDRSQGRHLYGRDPGGYALGRPDYPERVYELLRAPCGLSARSRVLEIGPGTGLVTRRLLAAGARVTAVEPHPSMGTYLGRMFEGQPIETVVAPFEEASFDEATFDLAVAGTSFHWVDQPAGADKLRLVLRSGGWAAIWWMLFEDPTAPDDFTVAAHRLIGASPSAPLEPDKPPFQIDVPARRSELEASGFGDVRSELIRSAALLDAQQTRALYATMAIVLRRSPDEQARLLDALEGLVLDEFGGVVPRRFLTAVYLARRP